MCNILQESVSGDGLEDGRRRHGDDADFDGFCRGCDDELEDHNTERYCKYVVAAVEPPTAAINGSVFGVLFDEAPSSGEPCVMTCM